jgi:hypothetical protein
MSNLIPDIVSQPSSILSACFLLLFLSFNPMNLYGFWLLVRKLDRRETLPDRLEDFPIHPTSFNEYLRAWEKVEFFKQETLKGNSCELSLSSNDINHIYLKGVPMDKYRINSFYKLDPFTFKYSNVYFHFHLSDNSLIERKVEYCSIPCIGMPDGIITETSEIKFRMSNGSIHEDIKIIEYNGRERKSNKKWSDNELTSYAETSTTLGFILTGDLEFFVSEDKVHRKLISKIISRIEAVQLSSEFILFRSCVDTPTD